VVGTPALVSLLDSPRKRPPSITSTANACMRFMLAWNRFQSLSLARPVADGLPSAANLRHGGNQRRGAAHMRQQTRTLSDPHRRGRPGGVDQYPCRVMSEPDETGPVGERAVCRPTVRTLLTAEVGYHLCRATAGLLEQQGSTTGVMPVRGGGETGAPAAAALKRSDRVFDTIARAGRVVCGAASNPVVGGNGCGSRLCSGRWG
jgi:hypothetical protein